MTAWQKSTLSCGNELISVYSTDSVGGLQVYKRPGIWSKFITEGQYLGPKTLKYYHQQANFSQLPQAGKTL